MTETNTHDSHVLFAKACGFGKMRKEGSVSRQIGYCMGVLPQESVIGHSLLLTQVKAKGVQLKDSTHMLSVRK